HGSGFQSGLTVLIGFPGGGHMTVFEPLQVRNVSASSFTLHITLADYGPYTLTVNNPAGSPSPTFGFLARSAPNITNVGPQPFQASATNQEIRINGTQFQLDLQVRVGLPGGGFSTLSGPGQVLDVTATSFSARILLRDPGNYTLQVVNPDFGTS